ncbi:MAG: Hpt domain-containing protein [Fuscovulum sp.]|jgi:HPt (histidine-containing phosphotransfer) domain-containing protein|nr:Hpt domain-containing protein [Fuscovulum sp.]
MIEWARLAELRAEIGDEDLADVVAMFLDEADDVVKRIQGGLPDPEMESQLHFLKGSALNLGLSDLAALCQEGERLAGQGRGSEADPARIVAIYEASKTAFLGALAEGNAA